MNAIIISPGMYSSVTDDLSAASRAREMADAALAEFNKRWPEEEKQISYDGLSAEKRRVLNNT